LLETQDRRRACLHPPPAPSPRLWRDLHWRAKGENQKLPFPQRNKKLVAARTQNSGNAALSGESAGSFSPAADWISLNQSNHPAPLYSVEGVHDVVPVKYGQEMFHRSGSVARPALKIFPKDVSSVLNGTN
jgi:hypothetical protein